MNRLVAALEAGRDLAGMEVESLARQALEGRLDEPIARALVDAFARRGPTAAEAVGLARVLVERAARPLFGGSGGALVSLSAPVGPWLDGALLAAAAGLRVALLVDDPVPAAAWGLRLPLADDPLDEPAEAARLLARTRVTALLARRFHPDLEALSPFGPALAAALPLADPSRAHLRLLVAPSGPIAEGWALALERQHLDRAEVRVEGARGGWRVAEGRSAAAEWEEPTGDPVVARAAALMALAGWGEGVEAATDLARQARADGREERVRGLVLTG